MSYLKPCHENPDPPLPFHPSAAINSNDTTMSAESPVPLVDDQPKRVILRLRYGDFDEDDDGSHTEAIETCFAAIGSKVEECNPKGRHVAHVEPRQQYIEGHPQASFHVTLDMEKDAIENPNMAELPHEIYSIRRQDDGTP